MTVNVLLAGMSHETNTFAQKQTGLDEFIANGLYRGEEMLGLIGTNTVCGGALESASTLEGVAVHPVVTTSAIPGGLVTRLAFETITGEIAAAIRSQRPDAIVLDLHGAMATETDDDGDGAILRVVRQAAGPGVPIVAVLDLHANIGPEMVEHATALVPYDTYPHVDNAERGAEALRIAIAAARGETQPVMAHRKIPLLPHGPKQFSGVEPTVSVMRFAHEVESIPGIISAGVCFAFPYADCPFPGMTVTVVADGDRDLANLHAGILADYIWSRRNDFRADVLTVEQAVHAAMEHPGGPVVIADLGDNPGGGSAADGTALLWGMLDLGAPNAAFALIADTEVVERAFAAGAGNRLETMLGGKTDDLHGHPVPVASIVQHLSDGSFIYDGPMDRGVHGTLGRTAVLACEGRHGNTVEVIVCERRVQPLDTAIFTSQGIDPTRKQVIGVKSAVHFRGSFGPIAARIVEADTPGLTSIDYTRFPYRKLARPIWPLDPI